MNNPRIFSLHLLAGMMLIHLSACQEPDSTTEGQVPEEGAPGETVDVWASDGESTEMEFSSSVDHLEPSTDVEPRPGPSAKGYPGELQYWIADFESARYTADYWTNSGAKAYVTAEVDSAGESLENNALTVSKIKGGVSATILNIPEGAAVDATGIAFSIKGDVPEITFDATITYAKVDGGEQFVDPNLRSGPKAMTLDKDEWQTFYMPFLEYNVSEFAIADLKQVGFFFFGDATEETVLIDDVAFVRVEGDEVSLSSPYSAEEVDPTKLVFSYEELPAIREKIENDETLIKVYAGLQARVEEFMEIPTDPYLGFKVENGEAYSYQGRMMHTHVLGLGFVGLIDEDESKIRKAVEMLVSNCSHFGPIEIFDSHRIALNVGDMALPVMIGYDWLNPYMTEEERGIVKARVYEYGKWIYRGSQTQHWGIDGHERECSNWNVVLHAPMGLAALILGDQPEWEALADRKVSGYLEHSVDADGAPRESGGYLSLGASAAYDYIAAVKRLRDKDLKAPHKERLAGISRYFAEMLFPWGWGAFMISQGDAFPDKAGWFIELSTYLQDPLGYWIFYRLYGDEETYGGRNTWGVSQHPMHEAVAPFIILGWDSSIEPKSPAELDLPLSSRFVSGQAAARTAWDDDKATVVHFKSDEIWGGWSHADDNTFGFFAYGDAIVSDAGAHYYYTRFHNAILVDGKGQAWKGPGHDVSGEITRFEDKGDYVVMSGDATQAYAEYVTKEPFLPIEKAHRDLYFVREPYPVLLVVDDVVMQGDDEHDYELLFHYGLRNHAGTAELNEETMEVYSESGRLSVPSVTRLIWPGEGVALKQRPDLKNRLSTVAYSVRSKDAKFVSIIAPVKPGEALPQIMHKGSPEEGFKIRLDYAGGNVLLLSLADGALEVEHFNESVNHNPIIEP